MNKEIKEILDFKENADYKKLSCDEIAILKDYITNLQQDNERLEKQLEYLRSDEYLNQVKWERNFNETMNKELKSRIEKAIEYIDSLWLDKDGLVLNIRERLHFILRGEDE